MDAWSIPWTWQWSRGLIALRYERDARTRMQARYVLTKPRPVYQVQVARWMVSVTRTMPGTPDKRPKAWGTVRYEGGLDFRACGWTLCAVRLGRYT